MNNPRYRIWDKKYNQWNKGTPSMDNFFILIDRSILEFNSTRYVLQISTGKFDKNNVEIFEGDIVKCDFYDSTFGKYHESGKIIEVKCDLVTTLDLDPSGGPDGADFYKNFEVIGNIFKNPELLPQ